MDLQHGDKLFSFYEEDVPVSGKFSFFGADFGTVSGFSQYIDGYIEAVKAIYNKYISCENYQIDVFDTIVYPLCFLYRHIVELYIKYLFFKYSKVDETEKERFVKAVSHKLCLAWKRVQPLWTPLLIKIDSSIDITLFYEFINEIDTFDSNSFRMRYPINKDLTSVHSGPVRLDVVGLHSKMLELFKMFQMLDYEVEGVIVNNDYNEELISNVKSIYDKYKDEINEVSIELNKLATEEELKICESQITSLSEYVESDLCCNPHEKKFEDSILNLTSECALILGLLIQVGREIQEMRCRLAINEEREKDFYKLVENTLHQCDTFLSIDCKYSNREMCYSLFEKGYMVTSQWLNKSLAVINNL